MNISSVNLNLLVAFEALLEERSVSRAAKRAGLSQPAMSNALARLRTMFSDPLFNRAARGIIPTARALELAVPVRAGLAHLRSVFAERPSFDPGASTRGFRLAMTDYAELRVLPALLERMGSASPYLQLLVRRVERIFLPPEADLRAGAFDAAIGFFPEDSALEPGTRSCDLFTEENVCIIRRGNPLLRKRFTLRQFASAAHAAVFYRAESRGLIDNILAGHGLRRRLQAVTPHFLTLPFLVAKSDLIAVVPTGLAAHFRRFLPIEIRKLPLLLPPFRMRMMWHEHAEDDPAHKWLRTEVASRFG
ncbi:MAG TPA: LysR family transcriptional regulator [Bryobacteraceae bacterium]|nr:LysR family transcriptional regulator [Bryobacteraceae bacterium]